MKEGYVIAREGMPERKAISRRQARDQYQMNYELERMAAASFYAEVDPRRRVDLADGGMVREDRAAMANLPRQAIHCEYPSPNLHDRTRYE